ncbi:NAD(P)-binding protein [Clavulina sp. PMI_390]|nr:NAD(P)-binding protein [Clavulina sp. PMI_390]
MSQVWFITGCSSGFGESLARLLLKRGHKVIATARKLSALDSLKEAGAAVMQFDVTAPLDEVKAIADKAVALYGQIDVVVNNAGYFAINSLEEATPQETYDQFNVNVFGPLNVARAFLPHMRKQKSGTFVWLGSVGGWYGGASGGLYCSTKHAIRPISESLHAEISPLGLRSVCLEPGGFRTSFLQAGNRTSYVSRIPDYAPILTPAAEMWYGADGKQNGDPEKFVQLMVDYVRKEGPFAEVSDAEYPITLLAGSDCYAVVKGQLNAQLEKMERFKDVIASTDHAK